MLNAVSSGRSEIHRSTGMEKLPKAKEEIAQLIIAELRSFDCKNVLGVVIVPIVDHADAATWTVSCFNVGKSDGEACDLSLVSNGSTTWFKNIRHAAQPAARRRVQSVNFLKTVLSSKKWRMLSAAAKGELRGELWT
jgi:hypothetical protein